MEKSVYDYILVGSGPGGLQLGYYLERTGSNYLILEKADKAGAFFEQYPRHRLLISINKVHTGYDDPRLNTRYDWNSLLNEEGHLFKEYSKEYFPHPDKLVSYLGDFASKFNLNIQYNTSVVNISSKNKIFEVKDSEGGAYYGRHLVMCTGTTKMNHPEIPGIEYAETYENMSIDPESFTNQRVLIVGKGNSAFETAENLIGTTASIHLTSPAPLKLAWKSHHVGHLRAINNNFLDTYLLKAQNGILDASIARIDRTDDGRFKATFDLTRANGGTASHIYDRIILCTGFAFDTEMFDASCRPEMFISDRFPKLTHEWESTNVKNMYFAGVLMQARDFKKTQSGFIHGFRYNIRALHKILRRKNDHQPWPSQELELTSNALCDMIFDRLNHDGAMWHQPGFLGDVLVVSQEDNKAHYYSEVPMEYLPHSDFVKEKDYYTITLEYGPDYPDYPFNFERHIDTSNAHLNPQLHPIIRRYNQTELIAEHHVLEEIEGQWHDDEFTKPLHAFLQKQLENLVNLV